MGKKIEGKKIELYKDGNWYVRVKNSYSSSIYNFKWGLTCFRTSEGKKLVEHKVRDIHIDFVKRVSPHQITFIEVDGERVFDKEKGDSIRDLINWERCRVK